MITLAIDPGKQLGYAIAVGSTPVAWGECKEAEALSILVPSGGRYDRIVAEMPFYRGENRRQGNPNAMVSLAWRCAVLVGQLMDPFTTVISPLPHVWKGRVTKEMHQARFRRDSRGVWAAALESIPETKHNATDALALLFWSLSK